MEYKFLLVASALLITFQIAEILEYTLPSNISPFNADVNIFIKIFQKSIAFKKNCAIIVFVDEKVV